MLVLTLRLEESVMVGGTLGTPFYIGDEEVTVQVIGIDREEGSPRVKLGILAPGKSIQRSGNLKLR